MTETLTVALPNGLRAGGTPSVLLDYTAAVDGELERRKGAGTPGALWPEELLPAYVAGLSPRRAAARILALRRAINAEDASSARRSLFWWVRWWWAEGRFQRTLRMTGRA